MRHRPAVLVVVLGIAGGLLSPGPGSAQQVVEAAPPPPRPASLEQALAAGSDEELDALVAPVALYPDALLAQVLVAATYPLDVVKADRWLAENAALGEKERADAAEGEDWDPSVQMLAGGFPDVIRQLAADLDATEALGDAVLAETDRVLDAVQRMRARAAAAGNLESNEAQVVETTDEAITIAPADPEVVYVPQYDPATAYVPYTGTTTGTLLTTGAVAFGTAMLFDEVFDDDDDWDDYWYGSPAFDWDDDAFYPGGVDIEGDVNINNIDRDDIRGGIDDADIDRAEVRERIDASDRIGDRDGSGRERAGAWQASPERREAAQQRIAAREAGDAPRGAEDKLRARSGDGGARAKLEAAAARRPPATMPSFGNSVLKPGRQDPAAVRRASDRAAHSLDRSRSGGVSRASVDRGRSIERTKSVSRPKQARPAAKRSPPEARPSSSIRAAPGPGPRPAAAA